MSDATKGAAGRRRETLDERVARLGTQAARLPHLPHVRRGPDRARLRLVQRAPAAREARQGAVPFFSQCQFKALSRARVPEEEADRARA
jgi:hypothetical protein